MYNMIISIDYRKHIVSKVLTKSFKVKQIDRRVLIIKQSQTIIEKTKKVKNRKKNIFSLMNNLVIIFKLKLRIKKEEKKDISEVYLI
jgi:hypothetical protein